MPDKIPELVIYFNNGRMVRLPANKVRFAYLGADTDEEYAPAAENGVAVVNWNNVCFVREWQEPEAMDL